MNSLQECQAEIRRLRRVINDLEENCVEYPFKQGTKVFGLATYCSLERKLIYLPEQCYYIAPLEKGEHVIQELMGSFKTVKDVFKTKEEAEEYIKKNSLN